MTELKYRPGRESNTYFVNSIGHLTSDYVGTVRLLGSGSWHAMECPVYGRLPRADASSRSRDQAGRILVEWYDQDENHYV